VRNFYHRRIVPTWLTFANAAGSFLDEATFRLVLAFDVLIGRAPRRVERRWWNRAIETPVLVDVYDWTNERLIFSVLVWPALEGEPREAAYDQQERVEQVLDAIARGAAEKMWSTRWELDYGLRWNNRREVWVDSDGHAYDGSRFGAGSRRPTYAA
jgi:hypothetical protein